MFKIIDINRKNNTEKCVDDALEGIYIYFFS